MQVSEHALFPTRLVTIQHDDVDELHGELLTLFADPAFGSDFNMHPDALNLLALAESHPCLERIRQMFLAGLTRWLEAEGVRDELVADMVLFSNLAQRGEFTLVHNHNADVVGVY